jgi:hypothetical protein
VEAGILKGTSGYLLVDGLDNDAAVGDDIHVYVVSEEKGHA